MPRAHGQMTGRRLQALPETFEELVRMHPPRALHDEAAYDNTQELVDRLTNIPKLTAGQGEYLETLSVLMQAYEQEHHAIDTNDVTPLETLRFLMAENDLKPADIGRLLGSASAASMILNRQREMSKAHIRALATHFKVDTGLFF